MAAPNDKYKTGLPWDLEAVQNLLSTLNVEPSSPGSSSRPNPDSNIQSTLNQLTSRPSHRGVGDLTPVLDLLKRHSADAQPFRELDRLPLPSWPTNYTAHAPSKDTYQSDGAALYRSVTKSTKSVPKIANISDDEDVAGNPESAHTKVKPKTRAQKKSKRDIKKVDTARQALSEGEATKSATQVFQSKKPASKAATHQAQTHKSPNQDVTVPRPILYPPRPGLLANVADSVSKSVRILPPESKLSTNFPPRNRRSKSDPHIVNSWLQRDKVHRDLLFRVKLIESFPEDRVTLSQTVAFKDHPPSTGIHVFIDFSNIWIGFMNHIRVMMGVSPNTPLIYEHRQLSFESLVFLLERGRPVGRSVLGGSLPWLPAFDTARRVGYECNILEKVLKDRSLTNQQKRHQYKAHRQSADSTATLSSSLPNGLVHKTYGATPASGPEIFVPSSVAPKSTVQALRPLSGMSPEKWVEQGVDEILHMKMLESLLDYRMPSTIVLATGDGAKAEYSDGFTKVLERALVMGWKVELVSWASSLSSVYKGFLTRWDGQFRFVPLEGFAEYLLEPSAAEAAF